MEIVVKCTASENKDILDFVPFRHWYARPYGTVTGLAETQANSDYSKLISSVVRCPFPAGAVEMKS